MDVPVDRRRTGGSRTLPGAAGVATAARHRRPSGEPPPLPHHLQGSGFRWLAVALVLAVASVVVFVGGLRGPAVAVTVADDAVVGWLAGIDVPGFAGGMRALAAMSSWWVLRIMGAALLLALLALRRFRHMIIWVLLLIVLGLLARDILGALAHRPRPFGVDIRAGWGGWAMPSYQIALFAAGLVSILYSLVPEGRPRNIGKWVATILVVLTGLGRVALGADAPTDVLVGAALGVTVPLVFWRLFTPSEIFPISYGKRGSSAHLDVTGARGVAIRQALADQLGLVADEVKPFGLSGSAGSTPLRIRVKASAESGRPSYLFGKLYARSHLRADRWYKLGRELLYGRLEDEKPFNAVRRLVQQEDYALSLVQRAGLPSPKPYGFVELTPEREYMLVTEFFDQATELGDAQVDDAVIDDGLAIIRKLWDAGLAHRDIKPANLLVRDGRLLLIDVAFVEARPSPWRQAVDLANMMLCLALRSDPDRVYERALRQFTVEEITEGFAAARGLALPSQLRRMLKSQGRDLHDEFVRLLPEPPVPVSIQRWSARRVVLLLAVTFAVVVVGGLVVADALDNEDAVRTPVSNTGDLECTRLEPLWLQAQAVPTATQVPCLNPLPPGWKFRMMAVNAGRSVINVGHDRAGPQAVEITLTATCDPTGATAVGSPAPGVVRSERLDQLTDTSFAAVWFDRFEGGCVTYRLHSTSDPEGRFAAELPAVVGLVSRESLDQALQERSDGRLRLDPDDR
jgi:tRNA A-37 threonylcarbamoyl transferase component Bud32/membrane-associated phospholipid phosphatase